MAEIIGLQTPDVEAQIDVVEMLEEILERAKRGEIRCFAAAAILQNRHTASWASRSQDLAMMLGALVILQGELTTAAVQGGTEIEELT